jgi:hypothetical protein
MVGSCKHSNESSGFIKMGNFLSNSVAISFSKRTLLHGDNSQSVVRALRSCPALFYIILSTCATMCLSDMAVFIFIINSTFSEQPFLLSVNLCPSLSSFVLKMLTC